MFHHQDQSNRNRNVGTPGAEGVDEAGTGRNEIANADSECHGQEDPDSQVAIQEAQAFGGHGRANDEVCTGKTANLQAACCFGVSKSSPFRMIGIPTDHGALET